MKKTTYPTKPTTQRDIHFYDMGAQNQARVFESGGCKNWDEKGVDNDPDIDVPLHARGGHFNWNFEYKKAMSITDKITWVLTAVNVAIFITLFVTNYYYENNYL